MNTIRALKEKLDTPQSRQRLAWVYGCREEQLTPVCRRLKKLMTDFCQVFDCDETREAIICTAAGRTELGGNHTDHQRGKVLAASVSLDAVACVSPNDQGVARLWSEGYGMAKVDVEELEKRPEEENTTTALVRGILARTRQLGCELAGFDAYICSDVPGGSGLSSSACYEVLVGIMVNQLFCHGELTLEQIAMMGQYAENVYFGKPSGLMDQMACALGGIVAIDFADKEKPVCRKIPFDFTTAGHALCIIDTGADHADLTGDYAAIPQEMKGVAALLGGEVLSEVPEETFWAAVPKIRAQLGDRAMLRAVHYYNDVRRVEQQAAALEAGEFDTFLRLVSRSGCSSFQYLQNVASFRDPATQPVAAALAMAEHLLEGRGGFRVHGGGFAGTIQAFVPDDLLERFHQGMDDLLGEGACRVLTIRPVGGGVLVE